MDSILRNRWRALSSLHRYYIRSIIPILLLALSVTEAKAQTDVKFNDGVRYSQWVIDSRLGDFYGNTNDFGFTTYNRDLSVKKEVTKWKNGSADPAIDYVSGLVAKATIEAADYYKAFDWAKPWFKSVEWYGNKCEVPNTPDNLDDVNASKMYFGIISLANGSFKDNAVSTTVTYANTQLGSAISALSNYNKSYAFAANTTLNGKDISGGWYHKNKYQKQMWLDGQYMGPAVLAQMIKGYTSYTAISDNDWQLITTQFSIVWDQCWNDTEKLLYHAFSSDKLTYWASDAEIWSTAQTDKTKWTSMTAAGNSAAFWGRAEGWYFLALVDVLEQMKEAGLDNSTDTNHSCYTTLKGYLDQLALGIAKHQDATSGCWYQLIGKDGSYSAQYYNGEDKGEKQNYLESSCTAIFAAAFLKATRLELLTSATDETTTYNYKEIGEKAYKGAVEKFMKQRADRTVDLLSCCKSAGLGTDALGSANFRDGSNAYYLLGGDVTPTSTNSGDYYTEGKVMGAFIMAATEYERANEKAIRFSYDLAPAYTLTNGESLTVEALGSGAESATYQWYNASDDSEVSDATSATFAPATSGSYYCKATSGTTTIQTSTAEVTVAASNEVNGSESLLATLPSTGTNTIICNGSASTINGSDNVMYGEYCYSLSNGGTCELTIPEGVTVSKIEIIGTSADNSNQSTISVSDCSGGGSLNTRKSEDGKSTLTFTPTTQASSYTITSSTKGSYIQIKVYGTTASSSSFTITTQPEGATYDVDATKVTALTFEVTTTGGETISYQWYKNTTNSTEGGELIDGDGAKASSYTPPVTTAGTTYYYCIATADGQSVTSNVVAVAVLNESNINYSSTYTYSNNNAWTPAVNGTIDVSKLVTSSSTGAYSITSGSDVATISGTTITALKAGTFTLSQEADDKYKAGSKDITVRIGTNVTNNETYAYSLPSTNPIDISDGMTIACQYITMTFGNDGFWSTSSNGHTAGQVTPVVAANNIPTAGTFYKFTPTTTGKLAVTVKINVLDNELRPLYVSENGTFITAKLEDGTEVGKGETPDATEAYINKSVTFPVKANTDYYVYVAGSKLDFYGFTFTPTTLYTVTFDAGSNGTCSTTSIMQEDENATITLPSVTANTGYKFDGWYTEAEGGNKVDSPYTPTENVTLYAHYTSTSSSTVIAEFENATKTTWTEKNSNGFTITGVSNIKTDGSAKLASGASITLNIPEGYTVTGFDFTLLCANTSEGSTLSVGDDEISVKDGTHTLHHMNLTSSVTGQTTLTIKNSGAKELNIMSIKVYGSTGKSISFTTQPESATYLKNATNPAALTVEAKVNNVTGDAPTISYKWYESTTNSTDAGTEIDGETKATYTPDVTTAGTKYYYCKATATVDEETLEAYSNIATITVNEPMLTIKTQPVGATYAKGQDGVAALMVEAETNTGETITYQWYSNTSESATIDDAHKISGATSNEYKPAVTAEGTTYYYCVVKAGSTLTKTTDIVAIVVNNQQPTYGYKVSKAGLDAPGINTSKYITTTADDTGATGEKLVKMTFGGWKWNEGTYVKPNDETNITDTWKKSETVSGVTVLDGYSYWFSGTQDAVQEDKTKETTMYGQTRYGWFISPERENGSTVTSYPYTLPVRGSFMTFEPTKNGTLTIYILQNGAWNTFDKATTLDGVSYAKGDIKPGEFRMHAFQVTNQRGLVLEEFAPKYTVTNNQKVDAAYSCTKYAESDRPTTFDKTSKDISQWEEFWKLDAEEREAVYTNWSNGTDGCQTIIKLNNGSFLVIQKAVVKYQFHVTGNETYYLFSNFSKMGFSGATFQPDGESGQPTDVSTFSGENSLSDTKAFPTIEKTGDGTIDGTNMPNYKFTIDNEEVGKVDGVFIPQFKAITLNRDFKKDQWTTLSLPFNLTQTEVEEIFGKGTEIIVFKDAITDGTKLHIKFIYHEIQNILPSYPYLIKPTLVDANGTAMTSKATSTDNAPIYTIGDNGNLTSFTVYGKAINPLITPQEFKSGDGLYVAKGTPGYCTKPLEDKPAYCKKYEAGDLFISDGNGTLYISKGESYGKGYRSYIEYTGDDEPSASTKSLSLSFSGVDDSDDNGGTTEIKFAELADEAVQTFDVCGVYNLNGQKVSMTTKNLPAGIYIVNGRKMVVK